MSKKINLLETGNMLLAAQKIVLCCHVSPDGDTLGSALGLARLLEQKGKEVTVFVDDDINKSFFNICFTVNVVCIFCTKS